MAYMNKFIRATIFMQDRNIIKRKQDFTNTRPHPFMLPGNDSTVFELLRVMKARHWETRANHV